MSRVAALIRRHATAWRQATHHPFLDAVRQGGLPPAAFAAWLVQDYLFVGDLLAFQARLLGRAPRSAQAVLAGGLVALEAELGWFEDQARRRSLVLEVARHPTTGAYRDFLEGLDEHGPYPAAVTALWAIERAYLEAWQTAAPGHPDYREFVEHWTVPAFARYVGGLERIADVAQGSDDEHAAEAAFLEVARLERAFWDLAWSGVAR